MEFALDACILTLPQSLGYICVMNDVQEKLSDLQVKGWTLVSLADELGLTASAIEKWKSGDTYPRGVKMVLASLNALDDRKPPKQRRYSGTHHLQRRAAAERDREDETE